MESKIWEKLFEDSCHFSKPAHAIQLVSEEDIVSIELLIKGIIQSFLKKGDLHLGLKTYVGNELRNDIAEHMLSDQPKFDDTLESWSRRIFGEERFGMILNYLENYSNEFSEIAASIVNPLLTIAGLPLNGISFLLFMGNYGFTPFGVHKEATGEDGILFHLGPGNKQFYTWDDAKYNAIEHNTEVFHEFDAMLPHAKCYELKPGDAMFIPHKVYHIANTPEYSLSFVMDYVNPPTDRFENQLLKLAGEEELANQKTYQKPLKVDIPNTQWNEVLDHQSIQRRIEVAFQRKVLSLKSNGGILRESLKRNRITIPNGSFSIRSKRAFRLYVEDDTNNESLIFARGHRIIKKSHPLLPELIEKLNDGESISIEFLREKLEPTWDLVEIYSFVGDLSGIEAIEIDELLTTTTTLANTP